MWFKKIFLALKFQAEPAHEHGRVTPRAAVLLVNLGTPDAPTASALRIYLAEFLSDSRVVEISKVLWNLILHGIILRTRPSASAQKYASIWRHDSVHGSPLRHWTALQAEGLQAALDAQVGTGAVLVRMAMRYGQPAIATQLDQIKAQGITRVLVLPLYPQYSAATTASVMDAVFNWGQGIRYVPELRFVNQYHDDALYIAALAARIKNAWQAGGRGKVLVMSFHGVPERTLHLGDPYHCQCLKTARLLAQALGLSADQYRVCFQSRFGRAQWLQPYTEPTLVALANAGIDAVDVVCPGFVGDCLETLHEINIEAREAFSHAGGKQFNYIECLNDDLQWLGALAQITRQHLSGWDLSAKPLSDLQNTRLKALHLVRKTDGKRMLQSFDLALQLIGQLDAQLLAIVGRSLSLSCVALLLGGTVGVTVGAWLGVARFAGRRVVLTLLNTLLALPSVVVGLLVYLLLSRSGPLGFLGWLFSFKAMAMAQAILVMPVVAALTRQAVENAQASHGEQWRSLGAGTALRALLLAVDERHVLFMVAVTAFGRAISEVGAVMVVGGNIDGFTRVMTTTIALETSKGDLPLALALGLILLLVVLGLHSLAALAQTWQQRTDRAVLTADRSA